MQCLVCSEDCIQSQVTVIALGGGGKDPSKHIVRNLVARKRVVWELMAFLSAGFAVCVHRLAYCTGLC